ATTLGTIQPSLTRRSSALLSSIITTVEQLSPMPRATDDEKPLSGLVQRETDRLARVLTEFLDFARTGMTHVVELNLSDIARNARPEEQTAERQSRCRPRRR